MAGENNGPTNKFVMGNYIKEGIGVTSLYQNLDFLTKPNRELDRILSEGAREKAHKEALIEAREEENNNLLKEIVANQGEQIERQDIVIAVLTKQLESANKTLDMIINSIGANSQKCHEALNGNSELLLELEHILLDLKANKDDGRLISFIKENTLEAVALLLQIIKGT